MDLAKVDLEASPCPRGLKIEIEDLGDFTMQIEGITLLQAIAHVYAILTGQEVITLTPDKVTLTRMKGKKVTARVAI